jgi:hypothetical protein
MKIRGNEGKKGEFWRLVCKLPVKKGVKDFSNHVALFKVDTIKVMAIMDPINTNLFLPFM